jgi:DNA-binding NtrC family response regulator
MPVALQRPVTLPRRGRRLRTDRRVGVNELLTRFLDAAGSTPSPTTLLDALTTAVRRVIPIASIELTHHRTTHSVEPVIAPGAITIPVMASSAGEPTAVHFQTPAGYLADRWDLEALQTLTRLFAALRVRRISAQPSSPRVGRALALVDSRPMPLLGGSEPMIAVRNAIDRLAVTDFSILIEGESGTGKELVARALHDRSHRRHGSFIAVNCAALVDSLLEAELFGIEDRTATGVQGRQGKFELADGGTLFLDEIADLSKRAQAALLRAVQSLTIERVGGHRSRHVDTRLIVATNQPLARLVARRKFRADLFYRLSGLEITLPPLRERPPDILTLAAHFVTLHGTHRHTLSQPVIDALIAYAWPGNVRELERVIQRALAWTDSSEIQLDALPPHVQRPRDDVRVDASLRAWTARHVVTVLQQCAGNKRLACRRLGISYHTLQAYVAKCRSLPRAA